MTKYIPAINCHIMTLRNKAKAIGFTVKTKRMTLRHLTTDDVIKWQLLPLEEPMNYKMKEDKQKLIYEVTKNDS